MIRTYDLTKRFGKTMALDHVNLDLPANSIFALAGPNGAGKSTLLHLLLNHFRSDGGRSEIDGVDSRRLSPKDLQKIGYVAESRQLPEWMKVAEFFRYTSQFYPNWQPDQLRDLIGLFRLPMEAKVSSLSRGKRMQVALAATLAYRPQVLLLDEPFQGLDVLVRDQVIESIVERSEESTVLLASHDLAEIESFATHFSYLSEGKLKFSGDICQLQSEFREVEVVLREAVEIEVPGHWMNYSTQGEYVRFTDSKYAGTDAIRERFQGVADITVRNLPLRSIFVEMAREGQKA
jgi:ABC-2 type transport system ATP-binding protein